MDGHRMRQVARPTAAKAFVAGYTVWLVPCNANLYSPWINPFPLNINEVSKGACDAIEVASNPIKTFNNAVNTFTYHNCIHELGKYPHFFVDIAYFKD